MFRFLGSFLVSYQQMFFLGDPGLVYTFDVSLADLDFANEKDPTRIYSLMSF